MCRNLAFLGGRTYYDYECTVTFSHKILFDLEYSSSPVSIAGHLVFFISLTQVFFQIFKLNDKDGQIKLTCLGNDLDRSNQQPQYTVPPYVWFGSFPTKDFHISPDGAVSKVEARDAESHYSLVRCPCAPAFQFEDF
ncbi:hypothetical protein ACOSP7_008662 [Xanthoceras sorbifolium]